MDRCVISHIHSEADHFHAMLEKKGFAEYGYRCQSYRNEHIRCSGGQQWECKDQTEKRPDRGKG